jgi:hypothetical protein
LVLSLFRRLDTMDKDTISADELIDLIVETLAPSDGECLEEVANSILAAKVKYVGDSLFELTWPE